MKIAELFADIGFNIDNSALNNFQNVMNTTLMRVGRFVAKVAAAIYVVKKFADVSINAAAAMRSFRVETGLSAEELQKWQVATQLTDITASAEQVTTSIKSLQSNLAQIRLGQGDVGAFQLLGVNPYGDAFQVLEQLRRALKGVDEATAVNLLQRMGLGAEMYHVLRLTRDEFDKLGGSYVLNQKQIDKLTDAGTKFENFVQNLKFRFSELNATLAPFYGVVADALSRGLTEIANAAKGAAQFLDWLITPLKWLIEKTGLMEELAVALGVVFAAMVLSNPLTATIAAIAGLVAVFSDLFVWIKGGNALFGKMYDWIAKIVDKIKELTSGLKNLKFEMPDFNILGSGGLLDRAGASITNGFNNVFNIVTDSPEQAANAIVNGLQNQLDFSQADIGNAGAR